MRGEVEQLRAQVAALTDDLIALRAQIGGGLGLPDPNGMTGRQLTLNASSKPAWTNPITVSVSWGEISGLISQQTDLNTALNAKATMTTVNTWGALQNFNAGWIVGGNPPAHLIPAGNLVRITKGTVAGVNWQLALAPGQALGRGSGLALAATFNTAWGGFDSGQRFGGGIAYIPIGSTNPRHHRIALYSGHLTTDDPVEVFSASLSDDVRIHQGLHLYANAATFSGAIRSPSITDTSDVKYKEDIRPLTTGMALIRNLLPCWFWNRQTRREEVGFVGHEVKAHIPEVVAGDDGDLSVAYQRLTAPIVAALQELDARMAKLEAGCGPSR